MNSVDLKTKWNIIILLWNFGMGIYLKFWQIMAHTKGNNKILRNGEMHHICWSAFLQEPLDPIAWVASNLQCFPDQCVLQRGSSSCLNKYGLFSYKKGFLFNYNRHLNIAMEYYLCLGNNSLFLLAFKEGIIH